MALAPLWRMDWLGARIEGGQSECRKTILLKDKFLKIKFDCHINIMDMSQRFSLTRWAWWLMPVISTLWEAQADQSSEVRVQDQPGQRGETPSLLKIQKLAGCGGACL